MKLKTPSLKINQVTLVKYISKRELAKNMKYNFAHLADLHIGVWSEPKLRNLPIKALSKAVSLIIEKKPDFVLISGDLFNTALPPIDLIKATVIELKKLKKADIPIYYIAGSHDYSPNGKTMLDIFQSVDLMTNVVKGTVEDNTLKLKFTVDKKTGVKITGIIGRRGMLDKHYYEKLDLKNLEEEPGNKIFMFHTAIKEMLPFEFEQMDSIPISYLPKGFDYYAGGHIHIIKEYSDKNYRKAVYPGPLFPTNFKEFENLKRGGFYFVEIGTEENNEKQIDMHYQPIMVINSAEFKIDCSNKTPEDIYSKINQITQFREFLNTIVLLRFVGTVKQGYKTTDIDFNKIYKSFYDKAAYYIMRNTSKLKSKEFEETKIDADKTPKELEDEIIEENSKELSLLNLKEDKIKSIVKQLMDIFDDNQKDGETKSNFEQRLYENFETILNQITQEK